MLDVPAVVYPFLTALPASAWSGRSVAFASTRIILVDALNLPLMGGRGASWIGLRLT